LLSTLVEFDEYLATKGIAVALHQHYYSQKVETGLTKWQQSREVFDKALVSASHYIDIRSDYLSKFDKIDLGNMLNRKKFSATYRVVIDSIVNILTCNEEAESSASFISQWIEG